jgi:hypothetical protein
MAKIEQARGICGQMHRPTAYLLNNLGERQGLLLPRAGNHEASRGKPNPYVLRR